MAIRKLQLAVSFNGLNRPSTNTIGVPLDLAAIHELQERVLHGENILVHTKFLPLKEPHPNGWQFQLVGPANIVEQLGHRLEKEYKSATSRPVLEHTRQMILQLTRDIRLIMTTQNGNL